MAEGGSRQWAAAKNIATSGSTASNRHRHLWGTAQMDDPTRFTYRLAFKDDVAGVGKIIEFEAFNAAKALEIARQEKDGRLAELWQGKELLCLLWRDRANIWKILVPSAEADAISTAMNSADAGTHCQCEEAGRESI